MYRCIYYVEVFIFLFLHHVGWNLPSTVFSCSRNKSRVVRMIIHKKMIPLLVQYKLSLPQSCPFYLQRDTLWWPAIQDYEDDFWMCPFCGQSFASESKVINHWDSEHAQTYFQNEDSVCLADFCDIFRCEVISAALELEKNKFLENSYSTVQSQKKMLCDESKMLQVQNKCKVIIRHCLLGLLSSISGKDFQDVEDEINEAICSYLTCEKYLDGSLHLVQTVSSLFSVIFGFILVGGFGLFCYVSWVLLNSFRSYNNDNIFHIPVHTSARKLKFRTSNGYH